MSSSPVDDVPFEGQEVIRDYVERFSNWGRWGEADQLGALNHVGPEQITAAAALVRQGKVISMGLPLDLSGPQSGGFRANPLNMMTATGTDYLAGKQDPLPGGFGRSKGFGFDAGDVTARGAAQLGIETAKDRFVMRGVLLDVARHRGVRCLEPGYAITAEELDATAAAQDVEIRAGDALIVRTGMTETHRGNWGEYNGARPPACHCTRRRGSTSTTSPRWPPTRGVARCGPTRSTCSSRCTSSRSCTWAFLLGRSGTCGPLGRTAASTASTSSCSLPSRCRLRGRAGSPLNAVAIK